MTTEKNAMIATTAPWGTLCLERLKQLGWTAVLSDDGIGALANLGDPRPDVVVVDCTSADIDIPNACEMLTIASAHRDMTILPVVGDKSGKLFQCLQAMGLTILETETDIAAVLDDLPLSAAQPGSADQTEPTVTRTRPLILLVDDDRDLLRALRLRFRGYDVDVETSTGGRQAVFKAIEVTPDVIVTDYSMPDGNAEYFIGQLRQQPSLHKTPVIVLTGWTFEGRTDTAHQRDMTGRFGAVAYLQKPLDFDCLVASLQEHCDLQPLAPDPKSIAS